MKNSVAIQILPNATSNKEVVRIVDEVIAYIESTGLNYYVGPFETAIEGDDYDQLMEVVTNCCKVAVRAGSDKVSAYVKIAHSSKEDILTIDEKVTKHHK